MESSPQMQTGTRPGVPAFETASNYDKADTVQFTGWRADLQSRATGTRFAPLAATLPTVDAMRLKLWMWGSL